MGIVDRTVRRSVTRHRCPRRLAAPVVVASVLGVATLLAACSDLASSADATVRIEAEDRNQALRLRQELMSQASTWGGVRVGERTAEKEGDISLTFSLPGKNLDAALGNIQTLDAQVDSTSIDVDRQDVDRTATTTAGTQSSDGDGQIELRVEIAADEPAAGAGALLRLVMAIFSVVGMAATAVWILHAWRRRFGRTETVRPPRNIVDLSDPPTEETPRVPRAPWN